MFVKLRLNEKGSELLIIVFARLEPIEGPIYSKCVGKIVAYVINWVTKLVTAKD